MYRNVCHSHRGLYNRPMSRDARHRFAVAGSMHLLSRNVRSLAVAVPLALVFIPPASAGGRAGDPSSQASRAAAAESTDRLIVKLRDPGERDPDLRIGEIGGRSGERLSRFRGMSGGAHVVRLARAVSRSEARALAARLSSDPVVAFAEPDLRMYPQVVPNDSYYGYQWNLFEAAGGINVPAAWDVTVGASSITIGVIDTGILAHADLAGRVVGGYDFIADLATANDGNGRDADARDPGDWGCGSNSSWHGTHVAGIIGAASNNGTGVAGINWQSRIVSARALGACGGYTSDIIDAMRWAAGIAVAGVPANPNPARVLNLSLGGNGACGTAFQNAVNDVTARGSVVVVAAGNGNADAAGTSPANCSGVIAVAATTRSGGKASYSNYGATVAIAAPGGGGGDGILSTLNSGTTTPVADNYAWYQGTSMAAPHVSAVVSLMLSATPSLTPAQVLAKLQSSARAFPTGTGADCSRPLCGAGIVNAAAALAGQAPAPPPPVSGRVNLAAAANGGVVSASSTYSASFPPSAVNNGDRRGAGWGFGGGWADATPSTWPDWVQIDLPATRTIAEIDVFSIQDNWQSPQEPTDALTFTERGLIDFEVQTWTGSSWQTVPGGSVTGNNKVWRKFVFAPVSTSSIRVVMTNGPAGYSRLAEIEAYEVADSAPSSPALVNVALQANGGVAAASSSWSADYPAAAVNDGDRQGRGWGVGGGWADASQDAWPDEMRIYFSGAKSISEIDVFSVQDDAWSAPQEPTAAMTFTRFGIIDFDVEYWTGSSWAAVPGGNVTGNDKVWRKFAFAAVTTTAVRVVVRRGVNGFSRLAEIEAYGSP